MERLECGHERRPARLVDAASREGVTHARVCGEIGHHVNDVGVTKEDEAPVPVVVGEGTEGLGAKRHAGVEFAG